MPFFISFIGALLLSLQVQASALFSQDGVKLNHTISKQQSVYIASYGKNIIIWKSTFELVNDSKKAIALRIPCYLFFAYSYLNPSEIQYIQKFVPNYTLSEVYKNYISEKPKMLNAKSTIVSERYFATFDNVDLRTAVTDWKFKFSFWY